MFASFFFFFFFFFFFQELYVQVFDFTDVCSLLNVKFYKKEKNSLILLEVEEMGVLTHRGYWRGNPKQ
jgi:hypothetical protein